MSHDMQALDLEEAASNDVKVSLSLLEYEQALRPCDRLRAARECDLKGKNPQYSQMHI
jgi:hypothetical protein